MLNFCVLESWDNVCHECLCTGVVKCKREMIATSGKVAEAPHLANRLTDHQKQDAWKLLRIYYSFITNI